MKNSIGYNIMATSFSFSTQENNEDWDATGMHGDVMSESSEELGGKEGESGSSTPPLKGDVVTTPPKVDEKKPPF